MPVPPSFSSAALPPAMPSPLPRGNKEDVGKVLNEDTCGQYRSGSDLKYSGGPGARDCVWGRLEDPASLIRTNRLSYDWVGDFT